MQENINIYIVEDESIVAKDIQNSLKKLGYNVLGISNNGEDALNKISEEKKIKIVLPLHPRTAKLLETNLTPDLYNKVQNNSNFVIIPPASFLEMIALEKNSKMIITDSGGVQKEAFFFSKPCITLRDETEWVELIHNGYNVLVGANTEKMIESYKNFQNQKLDFSIDLYGKGKSCSVIAESIIALIKK